MSNVATTAKVKASMRLKIIYNFSTFAIIYAIILKFYLLNTSKYNDSRSRKNKENLFKIEPSLTIPL